MSMWSPLVLLLALAIPTSFAGMGPDLTQDFKQNIMESDHAYLVEFYSEFCGGCQEFEPIWNQLVSNVFGKEIRYGRVNVDTDEGDHLFQMLFEGEDGVVPAVKIFYDAEEVPRGQTLGMNIIDRMGLIRNYNKYTRRLGFDKENHMYRKVFHERHRVPVEKPEEPEEPVLHDEL